MRINTMIFAALAVAVLAVAAPAVSQAQARPSTPPAAHIEQHPRAFRHRLRAIHRMRMHRRQRIRSRRRSVRRHRQRFAI